MAINFDVITLFPEMFAALTEQGISKRARERGLWDVCLWNPREFATDRHRTVDDRPYGGGPGMLMQPEPLEAALNSARTRQRELGVANSPVLYLSPQGATLTHKRVKALAETAGAILLCGRYEGVDERLLEREQVEEVSIGDFVLSGGELPAMVLMDAVIRQIPGALNDADSAEEDSFVNGLLDCPHYTRPEDYRGMKVPEVLLSGNHELIRRWRLKQSLGRTWLRRPDLISARKLDKEEQKLLEEFKQGR